MSIRGACMARGIVRGFSEMVELLKVYAGVFQRRGAW